MRDRPMTLLTWLLLGAACAPTLYLRFLPMVELPQYLAASSILMHLHDPAYGFERFYALSLTRAPAILPLYLIGVLGPRISAFLSVISYPLGLWALLRAQHKPIGLLLLSLPVLYASTFYGGFMACSLSLGLALLAIALLISRRSNSALLGVCALLPLTHAWGTLIVLAYVLCAALTRSRTAEAKLPWPWLAPLFLGALDWGVCALRADGVARYDSPGLAFRLLRFAQEICGGFVGPGETYLLGAQVVLWLLLVRSAQPWRPSSFRALSASERALSVLWWLSVLGYLCLPKSTWTTGAINTRCGVLAFALLPALVPARALEDQPRRIAVLLLVLGASVAWYANVNLSRFDAEARPFASVLEHVPPRSTIVGLDYDVAGKVAHGAPYLYFPAYAQAARGGFLALSLLDFSWTVPLRRRADANVLPAPYGSEWDPALLQVQPHQFLFYDLVLVRGKEPREMTIFMESPFKLVFQTAEWLVYAR